ncbi:hypothetical protein [Mesorhizobium sp.]|uniref:hypothetical protein n=1 Tax=Mesorhizobium sp. TaxID=1871066 RepID=UPI000FE58C51|nr:hypothetical protein [Mesorhizobium sp.]RWE31179.1 MAG: hypothetical protein EOS77_17775 [Mesorhizobium sp.]
MHSLTVADFRIFTWGLARSDSPPSPSAAGQLPDLGASDRLRRPRMLDAIDDQVELGLEPINGPNDPKKIKITV